MNGAEQVFSSFLVSLLLDIVELVDIPLIELNANIDIWIIFIDEFDPLMIHIFAFVCGDIWQMKQILIQTLFGSDARDPTKRKQNHLRSGTSGQGK